MRITFLLCSVALVVLRCTTLAQVIEAKGPAAPAASGLGTPVREKLPAAVDGVAVGGGGKYLVLHLKKLQVLAVFDAAQGKVLKYLPMPTNELAFAAGAEKLFIGLKDLKVVQRWDLAKLALEVSGPAPEGGIGRIAVGANAAGPVLLTGNKRIWQLDPATLQATRFPSKNWGTDGSAWGPVGIHVSFDGTAAVASGGGWAGMELSSLPPGGTEDIRAAGAASSEVTLSGDGQLLFDGGNRIVRNDLASTVSVGGSQVFAAHDPAFSVAYEWDAKKKPAPKPALKLFCNSDPRVIATLHDVPELAEKSGLPMAQRVHLIPALGKLVTLGGAGDELIVRPFDLTAALAAEGGDYLFVASSPPSTALRGAEYSYAMKVRSKEAGETGELQAGPPGMKLEAGGKLLWPVPADFPERTATVIIKVANPSGKSIFHSFMIRVLGKRPEPQVASAPPARPGASAPPKSTPPAAKPDVASAADEATVYKLPEAFAEFRAANGGRHLVFRSNRDKQLAVYDTVTGKLIGTIPLAADDAQVACGRDAILVALPAMKVLQRYDLQTLKRTKSAPLPDNRPLNKMKMGNDSAGPVFLHFGGELVAVDGTTLARVPLRGALPSGDTHRWFDFRVSSDGSTVVAWDSYASPGGFAVARIRNGAVTTASNPWGFSHANRNFTPTADGSFVVYGEGVYDASTRQVPSEPKGIIFVPTSDPRFLIAVRPGGPIRLCTTNDRRTIAELDKLPDNGDGEPAEPRVIYLPEKGSVALIPRGNDRIELRPIAVRGTAVVSLPPAEVGVNETFTYPIQVLPEMAAVKFKVESGPPGLTVSPAGVVTWKPAGRPVGGSVNVVLSVVDGTEREFPHAFEIKVTRGGTGGGVAGTAGGGGKPAVGAAPPTAAAGGIVKVDDHRMELPAGEYRYIHGMAGRALVLAGAQLATLAPDGFTIEKQVTLPKAYVHLGERRDYYVGLCQEPRSIDVIDKRTLKVLRTRAVAFDQLGDLALHPERAISYVTYAQRGQTPQHRFLIFYENSAEARTDDNWIGQWACVAPDGDFLLTGFQMTYRRGHDIIDNPDRIWIVPRYGSIDSMARYDLAEDTGLPTRVAHREKVGGNGNGIRLSADGRRATYLSHTGYPGMSGNLGGWDPTDFSRLPVSYGTKDVATTKELAFHPILPLVASHGKGGVVFFHRESGAKEEGRVDDGGIVGEGIERLHFSPDGKSLLAQTTVNSIRYLIRLPLKLSPEELKVVGGLPRPDKAIKALPRAPERQRAPGKLPQQEASAPGVRAAGPEV